MTDQEFLKSLQSEDELGAVIRAHLYIEYLTERLLTLVVQKPELLKPLNLDFDGKVSLLMALGVDPDIKKPLSVLGGMRNKFAHRPNYKLNSSEINNLYKSLSPDDQQLVHSCYNDLRQLHPDIPDSPAFNKLSERDKFILLAIAIRGVVVSTIKELEGDYA